LTLVVARQIGDEIRILSDSRITDATTRPRSGVLKTITLSPTLCVSYAGNVTSALDAIRAAVATGVADGEVLANQLHEASRGGAHPDFIVATLFPHPRLFRVTCRGVEPDITAAWVGDQRAFDLYQRGLESAFAYRTGGFWSSVPPATQAAMAMSEAMGAVVASGGAGSVDEPIIEVTSRTATREGFKYLEMVRGYGGDTPRPLAGRPVQHPRTRWHC
jgi:hypothetical protein